VGFYYVYKSLAHPEFNNYVKPYSLEERLMHVREAEKVIGSQFQWICDDMSNELKYALGSAPNAEFIIDSQGLIVQRRVWSDPHTLRTDLEKLVGVVDNPTRVEDLNMPEIKPAGTVAQGIAPRVVMPANMMAMKVKPVEDEKYPFYVKLRAEADAAFLLGESDTGQIYLGFHLDPLYHVHWNNEAAALEYSLTTKDGVIVSPAEGKFPEVTEAADADPREFLLEITVEETRSPIELEVRYFACDDALTFCVPVTQHYSILLERDRDGGSAMGRTVSEDEEMSVDDMVAELWEMDSDGNGKLGRSELLGPFRAWFEEYNLDGDDVLSAEEVTSMATAIVDEIL